jgi:Family of unknown function (DUF6510)
MAIDQMRLDGNAAGGVLRDVFTHDMTAALATCAHCGKVSAVGSLLEYGRSMGVVLRCVGCEAAMLRIVQTPGSLRLDPSGILLLVIPEPVA